MERNRHPLEVVSEVPDDCIIFGRDDLIAFGLIPEKANTDLVCGKCDQVLIAGQTVATFWLKMVAKKPVFIECPMCRAYNRVPHRGGSAEEIFWLITDGE